MGVADFQSVYLIFIYGRLAAPKPPLTGFKKSSSDVDVVVRRRIIKRQAPQATIKSIGPSTADKSSQKGKNDRSTHTKSHILI